MTEERDEKENNRSQGKGGDVDMTRKEETTTTAKAGLFWLDILAFLSFARGLTHRNFPIPGG